MDGLECVAEIRRREEKSSAHIPIVALTAHAANGDRCERSRIDEYFTKPLRPRELFHAIELSLIGRVLSSTS
jgi:CheY-like chemotaxis protein